MKKLIILIAVVASAAFATAQKVSETKVPEMVKSVLYKKYPNAQKLKWEKEGNNYEAGFVVATTSYSLLINASGSVLETEVAIGIDALPAAAKAYILKTYPGKKIKEAATITDSESIVTYEAEVNGKDLIFDNMGTFLKEVKD